MWCRIICITFLYQDLYKLIQIYCKIIITYGDKEFTRDAGRNLESIVDSENEYSYTYDENGVRTSKTVKVSSSL